MGVSTPIIIPEDDNFHRKVPIKMLWRNHSAYSDVPREFIPRNSDAPDCDVDVLPVTSFILSQCAPSSNGGLVAQEEGIKF
jgi:hypothetical protein